jgi:hypothetical protein
MSEIELTESQRQALHAERGMPVDVVDPATRQRYVLLAREQYERVRAILEQQGPGEEPTADDSAIPPGIFRSQQAFWRDLPDLLKQRRNRGKWVAYHGDERVGTAATKPELVREILRRGIPRDGYYVGRIQPQTLAPWEPVDVEPIHPRHLEVLPPQT